MGKAQTQGIIVREVRGRTYLDASLDGEIYMIKTQVQGIIAREIGGRNYLDAPHLDGEISFIPRAFGPDYRGVVAKQIKEAGLEFPTMAQNASLVHTAWQNPKQRYSADIRKLQMFYWMRDSDGILYIPNEGAYIDDNPQVQGNFISMDKSNLVKRLESGDLSVRFVPFGFKIGEQSSRKLAKNQFVIALAGEEGAEKLAEVSDKYNGIPYVRSFDDVDSETTTVACLGSDRSSSYERLYVYGNYFRGCGDGFALGKLPQTAEGRHAKLK